MRQTRRVLNAVHECHHGAGLVGKPFHAFSDFCRRVVPCIDECDDSRLQVQHSAPCGQEHVGRVVAAEFPVGFRERGGDIACRQKRILDDCLGSHHV